MRQAGQGGAPPGLKRNSGSLAGLTFASLGHGDSRARRRDQAPFTQLFVFSSPDALRHGSVTGWGGGAFVEMTLRMKRGEDSDREGGSEGEKKG